MNSINSNWIRNILIGKPQDDHSTVYRNLLNLLPNPAILINLDEGSVLFANSEFNKLTAFSLSDYEKMSTSDLFDVERIKEISTLDPITIELCRHNREKITCYVWKNTIDEFENLTVITFVTEQQFVEQQQRWQDNLFNVTKLLLRLIEKDTIEESLEEATKIIGGFFETNHIYIYSAKSDFPELELTVKGESESVFPEVIPSSDIILEPPTTIWSPGTRMKSELQKAARRMNLMYVATTALGPGRSVSALLVVAHEKNQPSRNMVSILEVFGSALSTLLQYFILVKTLRNQINLDHWNLSVKSEVLNQIIDGVLVLKSDLSIWNINPSAELMLGYQTKEVLSQPIENILIGPDSLIPMLESARIELISHRLGIVHVHRRNGDALPVELRIIPVVERDELFAILIFLRDVSENEEIRIRAQQLEHRAVLGEFTAVFAHEVRNPINNISMGLQLLERNFAEDLKNRDLVEKMIQDCDRLTHLMEAVLAFSKPFDARFESIDIGMLVQRVIDRWKPRMMRLGITEFVQKQENLPRISADPRLLEQVFTNLIGNAVEAMAALEQGTIAVKISENQTISNHPQIEITITDSGPGIPEEVRGHIFEPFVTTKKTGTGLGLAISKRIMTAHRGNIAVESYAGGGTVFAVYLPVKQGEFQNGNNNLNH